MMHHLNTVFMLLLMLLAGTTTTHSFSILPPTKRTSTSSQRLLACRPSFSAGRRQSITAYIASSRTSSRALPTTITSAVVDDNIDDQVIVLPLDISNEMENLEHQLALIEALEQRNEAQLESFVDKEDQWKSLEEDERQLLENKLVIQERMEVLVSELVNSWMGQKSMEG
mmetsp:Transcript_29536/g.48735  ORF Transcript_29536/g.48735 Transcript_29536/m.48735 type:complete len:170 (-) Transcript_29536:11-520(-)